MNNVLIVSSSPRNGNSARVCKQLSDELLAQGINATLIELSGIGIEYCNGCLKCEDEGICPIQDGMVIVQKAMCDADTIVFGTPVYFDNMPGKLKSLIDRSNLFMSQLKGKRCAVFMCGQADETSWGNCASIIKNYSDICDMRFMGHVAGKARTSDDMDAVASSDFANKILALLR